MAYDDMNYDPMGNATGYSNDVQSYPVAPQSDVQGTNLPSQDDEEKKKKQKVNKLEKVVEKLEFLVKH